MNLHDADISSRLARFLGRKAMPRRLEGKPSAEEDEVRALCAALSRNAPRGADALAQWWPAFEAALGEICGAMWPTEREVKDAAQGTSKAMPAVASSSAPDMRPEAMAARRMQAGEPVGEHFLYGFCAVEMIAAGLVDEGTMRRYRSGAFLARREAYGEEAAAAWETAAKAKHDAAKQVYRHRNDPSRPRDVIVPDKAEKPQWDDAG